MFDTTLGTALGFLVRMIWLIVSQILGRLIQHPLIATGLAIFVGIISQTDLVEKLKETYEKAIDWLHGNNIYKCHPSYDYSIVQGPHTWLEDAGYQSPINIEESQIQRLAIRELLNWNHYDDLPASIQLENTGQTLVLRAQFHGNAPTISGADLLASYTFVEMRFRWGWCNSEGSEHTLNHRKFPLEMQVMHRAGSGQPRACTSSYDLLMIAYVFELSAHNPFLDPLIQNLRLVQQPGKRVCIPPFPLSYLMYAFRAGFYSYGGSLTQPPCYQGTEWFIFPESLAISDFQLRHFRQLLSTDGITPITRNSRPVQHLGNRVINLNCFCPYDANQLARMHVELCQQQQQKLEEEQQQQEQEEQEHRRPQQEQQQQQQQQQEQHQQQESEQQQHFVEKAPLATTEAVAFEDEGHLIETLDTTTIISSSNSSICMTTLMRKQAEEVHGQAIHNQQEQPQNQNQNSCRIIFTGGSADTNNNTNKCGLQRDQSDDIEITGGGGEGTVGGLRSQSSCDALCGVGDGVNVGNVRVELIE